MQIRPMFSARSLDYPPSTRSTVGLRAAGWLSPLLAIILDCLPAAARKLWASAERTIRWPRSSGRWPREPEAKLSA